MNLTKEDILKIWNSGDDVEIEYDGSLVGFVGELTGIQIKVGKDFVFVKWMQIDFDRFSFYSRKPLSEFEIKYLLGIKLDYSQMIDCSAIKAPDGRIWTGKRHSHCIATIVQATGVKRVGEGYEQGFVTAAGEFVDREEAARRALKSGQVVKLISPPLLYSEDCW